MSRRDIRAVCFLWQLEIDGRIVDPYSVVSSDLASRRLARYVLRHDEPALAEDVESAVAVTGLPATADGLDKFDWPSDQVEDYLAERAKAIADGGSPDNYVQIDLVTPVLDGTRSVLFVDLDHDDLTVSDGSSVSNVLFEVAFEPSGEYLEVNPKDHCRVD